MNRDTYARLRRIYLNTTFYARNGRTRYNGQNLGPADASVIKPTQRQLVALRAAYRA